MLLLVIYSPEVVPSSPDLIPCVKGKEQYTYSLLQISLYIYNLNDFIYRGGGSGRALMYNRCFDFMLLFEKQISPFGPCIQPWLAKKAIIGIV